MDTSVLSHRPLLYRHQKTIDTNPQNASSSILIYLLHWLHIIFLNYEAALLFTNLDNLELINETISQLKLDNHIMHDYFEAKVK